MKKKRKLKVLAISILLILIAIVVIKIKLGGSSNGITVASKPAGTSTSPTFNFTPMLVNGKYASFSYPVSLVPTTGQKLSGAILEAYTYDYRDIETWLLAISVNQLHYSDLSQDSGYELRVLNPSQYKKSEATFGKNQYIIMTDTTASGFSEIAFSLNGDMSGDISLYGDDTLGTQNLVKTFDMVLNTWKWE